MATHGVTANTPNRLLIDAGALYINWGESGEALVGATRGGNEYKVEKEQREMPFDGAHGPVKGGKRYVNTVATITANIVELTVAQLLRSIPGATSADFPASGTKTHTLITCAADIADSDYITNVAIVGKCTASPTNNAVCLIENALCDGNLGLSWNDKDESVLAVTFTAHFDPSDLDTDPWKVYYPE